MLGGSAGNSGAFFQPGKELRSPRWLYPKDGLHYSRGGAGLVGHDRRKPIDPRNRTPGSSPSYPHGYMIQQVDPVAPGLDLGRKPGGQVRPGRYSARGGITQVRVATHGKTRMIGPRGGVKSEGGAGKLVSPSLDHDSERRSLRDDKLPHLVPLHQRAAALTYPRGKS